MSDLIKEKYKKRAIIYDNIWMYFIKTAKEVIKDCENKKINILGLEAFSLSGRGIQPSLERSIDFNPDENNWDRAIDFLTNETNREYLYEIWYEGY